MGGNLATLEIMTLDLEQQHGDMSCSTWGPDAVPASCTQEAPEALLWPRQSYSVSKHCHVVKMRHT